MASFTSADGGYIRGNEAFDPLFNGQTVAQIVGQATFVPNVGIRVENTTSYVKYAIPQTITSRRILRGGSRACAKRAGRQIEGHGHVQRLSRLHDGSVSLRYSVPRQYRVAAQRHHFPRALRVRRRSQRQIRARHGHQKLVGVHSESGHALSLEGDLGKPRPASRSTKAASAARLIYNIGVKSSKGTYNPVPQFAYLGAPPQRSGEDASIPGSIYRNVWIGARPRPF